jgi:signal transduction histidine kinase
MNGNPTYDDLFAENKKLRQKVEWLEGVYDSDQDNGLEVRRRFLSNLSHEIRTPMNAILGFSSLLHSEKLSDAEKGEYVSYISHNSRTLLKVLDNIIDLSLLETNNLTLRSEEVLARDLIKDIYEDFHLEMAGTTKKRVAYLMNLPHDHDRVIIQADGHRLRRVIDNLVSSATTYQKKGVIELKLEIPDESRVVFSVGCDENTLLVERATMIFDNLSEENSKWYNEMDNTGVALKLARSLVDSMGGVTRISREPNHRFRISIVMPVKEIRQVRLNGAKHHVQAILI